MDTDTIPVTLPTKENTCLRCHQPMSLALEEACEVRRCVCGYWSRTISGDTKVNYAAAVGTFTVSRRSR